MFKLSDFVKKAECLLVIVSTLLEEDREDAVSFLLNLRAPVYLEGVSGIREDVRLSHLRVTSIENLWKRAKESQYPLDAILRIGGVPTLKAWRDLENLEGQIAVCSISHLPFPGLSWSEVHPLSVLGQGFTGPAYAERAGQWLISDRTLYEKLQQLMQEEPQSEPALVHALSRQIPEKGCVYLGNSLPIREWDFAATYEPKSLNVYASRGVNGIDGQISTFLGLAKSSLSNWGLFGDLTVLYDLAAPWIIPHLGDIKLQIVAINNGGGKIFKGMFREATFQNNHTYDFEHFAKQWNLAYTCIEDFKSWQPIMKQHFLEIQPCLIATERFWKTYRQELLSPCTAVF